MSSGERKLQEGPLTPIAHFCCIKCICTSNCSYEVESINLLRQYKDSFFYAEWESQFDIWQACLSGVDLKNNLKKLYLKRNRECFSSLKQMVQPTIACPMATKFKLCWLARWIKDEKYNVELKNIDGWMDGWIDKNKYQALKKASLNNKKFGRHTNHEGDLQTCLKKIEEVCHFGLKLPNNGIQKQTCERFLPIGY